MNIIQNISELMRGLNMTGLCERSFMRSAKFSVYQSSHGMWFSSLIPVWALTSQRGRDQDVRSILLDDGVDELLRGRPSSEHPHAALEIRHQGQRIADQIPPLDGCVPHLPACKLPAEQSKTWGSAWENNRLGAPVEESERWFRLVAAYMLMHFQTLQYPQMLD